MIPSQPPPPSRRRTRVVPLLPSSLLLPLLFTLLLPLPRPTSAAPPRPTTTTTTTTTTVVTGTYLPLSYPLQPVTGECMYERISSSGERLTASVLVVSGEDMRVVTTLEGPVAPIDLDILVVDHNSPKGGGGARQHGGGGGAMLAGYLKRYEAEGSRMFVDGKFGDAMMNVKPIKVSYLVDFEEGEEGEEEEEVEEEEPTRPPSDRGRPIKEGGHGREEEDGRDDPPEEAEADDAYLVRERANIEHLHREAEVDDDFVKLQVRNLKPAPVSSATTTTIVSPPEEKKDGGENDEGGGRRPPPPKRKRNNERRRRLSEATTIRPPAGEPHLTTVVIESPGWYRLCAYPTTSAVIAEMELRKESTHGRADPRTGHVPGLEEVEIHSEIRALYEEEGEGGGTGTAAGGGGGRGDIEDEDLRVTREQLRILERVYSEMISKQLEERRKWNWRTIKNQHLYSHLVLGNLVETVVYMGITGWQVYTIRKWFGGGPKLGR